MNRSRPDPSPLSSDVHDLLVRRSERLKAPLTEAASDEDAMWAAAFFLGDEEYAIALPALRAAVPLRGVTPVPRSSRVVIGVFQFQGEVIAALSTAALLGSGWSVDATILLVMDVGGGRLVALDCAQVPVAIAVPFSLFRQAQGTATGALSCVAVPGRGLVSVVDVAQLLEEQDWGRPHADT